jgi:uncharacterized membrane protein SpoIIM required for sporulation
MLTIIIFVVAIVLFAEWAFIYSIRKVNKTQSDFREKSEHSTNEKEKEIYLIFIKKYTVVRRTLVVCMIITIIIGIATIAILVPLY